jgi:hypothetical protein
VTNIASLLKQAGTIRYWQAGPLDSSGVDPTDDWVTLDVACALQERARQENAESGQLSQTTWIALLPPDVTPPKAADELVVGGVTYQFRGDTWLASSTRGGADHIEATLARAE